MRALIVLPSGVRGGAEAVAFSLARECHSRGIDVVIYALVGGMQPELEGLSRTVGVTIIAPARKQERIGVLQAIWTIRKLSSAYHFDVVYSTHVHVNALLGLMRRLRMLNCGSLVARESTVIFDRFRGGLRALFRFFYLVGYGSQDLLIAQTDEMRRNLILALGRSPVRRFDVIRNPVDIERISALSASFVSRPSPDFRRIVACGRLVANKGFGELIEAFVASAERFPDYRLELIGDGPEGARIRSLTPDWLEDRVLFHGPQENPFAFMRGSEIGVICSRREGFPNVLLEMMACGVSRIVATPCTRALDEVDGLFMADGFTPQHLSKALEEAMESIEDRREIYAAYIEREHSLERFCTRVIQAH